MEMEMEMAEGEEVVGRRGGGEWKMEEQEVGGSEEGWVGVGVWEYGYGSGYGCCTRRVDESRVEAGPLVF